MNLESSDEEYFDTISEFHENGSDAINVSKQEIIENSIKIESNFCPNFPDASKIHINNLSESKNLVDPISTLVEVDNVTTVEQENLNVHSHLSDKVIEVPISFNENIDLSDSSNHEEVDEVLDKSNLSEEVEQTNDSVNKKSNEEIQLEERLQVEASLPIEELMNLKEKSLSFKEQGNFSFKLEQYETAIEFYTNALSTCPLQFNEEHAIFYSNRGMTLAKLNKNEEAIKDLSAAIELKPQYLKALLKRAELREKTEKLTEALEDYREILKIDPRNWSALYAEQTLPEKIKIQQEKMKEEMFNQLKQLGNLVLKPFGLSTENFKMVQDPSTGSYSINFQNK